MRGKGADRSVLLAAVVHALRSTVDVNPLLAETCSSEQGELDADGDVAERHEVVGERE